MLIELSRLLGWEQELLDLIKNGNEKIQNKFV